MQYGIRTFVAKHAAPVALALTLPAASAYGAVLDFEGFALGQIIDDEYAVAPAPGTSVVAVNLSMGPNAAIIFDTGMPTGGDFDLAAPFDSMDPNLPDNYDPGNVLIIQETNDCDFVAGFCTVPDDENSMPAGEFEFTFGSPIILQSLDFFDIEFNENDMDPDSEILLYDSADVLIATFFVPNTGGDNMWAQVDFGGIAGVARMVVEMNGSGAIDNLTYVVPVPAAAWLFGSALLGLFGFSRKRA